MNASSFVESTLLCHLTGSLNQRFCREGGICNDRERHIRMHHRGHRLTLLTVSLVQDLCRGVAFATGQLETRTALITSEFPLCNELVVARQIIDFLL